MGLPVPLWRAVQAYIRWDGLGEPSEPPKPASEPRAWSDDFDVHPDTRHCAVSPPRPTRVLELAGIGPRFDFVIYSHLGVKGHDHLLIFRRTGKDDRVLAFSCVGKLPRKAAQVAAAVAAGRCTEVTGPYEAD
jgi:hypothetical protein